MTFEEQLEAREKVRQEKMANEMSDYVSLVEPILPVGTMYRSAHDGMEPYIEFTLDEVPWKLSRCGEAHYLSCPRYHGPVRCADDVLDAVLIARQRRQASSR